MRAAERRTLQRLTTDENSLGSMKESRTLKPSLKETQACRGLTELQGMRAKHGLEDDRAGLRETRRAFKDLTNLSSQQPGGKEKSGPGAIKALKTAVLEKTAPTLAPLKPLSAVDAADINDPQACSEYAEDIMKLLKESEHIPGMRGSPTYMSEQEDINAKMRGILIDWLIEVSLKYKLREETMYLCVNLLDRYLTQKQTPRTKLQLVGVTALLIASKYEDIYPPEVRDLVNVTDKTFTRAEIMELETQMLQLLKFKVTTPSAYTFLLRYSKVQKCDSTHKFLAQYALNLVLPDYKMLQYAPSMLASGALFLSNKIMKLSKPWPEMMEAETGYTEAEIKTCAKELCSLLQTAPKSSLQSVRRKFASSQYERVSKMIA